MGGWVALEEWKLRLSSAKVKVEVEAELVRISSFVKYNNDRSGGPVCICILWFFLLLKGLHFGRVFFWVISVFGVVFIFGAVFIAIQTMNECTIVHNFQVLYLGAKRFFCPKTFLYQP